MSQFIKKTIVDDFQPAPGPSRADFDQKLEKYFQSQMNLEGQVVRGVVVSIDGDMALIDVNSKSEGRVALKEFSPGIISVGDHVDVVIVQFDGRDGLMLSHEKARQEAAWQFLSHAYQNKVPVEGEITGQVKGGLTVNIRGTTAFLPGSQIDIRPVKDLSHFLNTTQEFIILKMDDARNNIVVSRRVMLEASRASEKQSLLSTLEQGQILDGVVKNLVDYGAFVDLGGIDGLLHITDISWKRISDPSEVLSVGQIVKVMVTRFNKETQRISLGMRQLEKDPWVNITERHNIGDKIHGVITNVTDYGAFVEMNEGLEGLVYMDEMEWCKRTINPKEVVTIGQEIDAIILDIDPTKRRISLSMKQCTENPLKKFEEKHPVGSTVEADIKDITEFGLLVRLPEGLDAAINIRDLSWDYDESKLFEQNKHILDHFENKEKITLKVLNINVEREIIGLGVKQLMTDPWIIKASSIQKGKQLTVYVRNISDHGLEVSLDPEGDDTIITMISRQEIMKSNITFDIHNYTIGQSLEAKVVSFQPESHHLTLVLS